MFASVVTVAALDLEGIKIAPKNQQKWMCASQPLVANLWPQLLGQVRATENLSTSGPSSCHTMKDSLFLLCCLIDSLHTNFWERP